MNGNFRLRAVKIAVLCVYSVSLLPKGALALDENIPAILQFAEQYQVSHPKPTEPDTNNVQKRSEPRSRNTASVKKKIAPKDNSKLQEKLEDKQLYRQQTRIAELQRQVENLQAKLTNEQASKTANPLSDTGLTNFKESMKSLRQKFSLPYVKNQAAADMLQKKSQEEIKDAIARAVQSENKVKELQLQLSKVLEMVQAKESEVGNAHDISTENEISLNNNILVLTNNLNAEREKTVAAEIKLKEQQKSLAALSLELERTNSNYVKNKEEFESIVKRSKSDIQILQAKLADSNKTNETLTLAVTQKSKDIEEILTKKAEVETKLIASEENGKQVKSSLDDKVVALDTLKLQFDKLAANEKIFTSRDILKTEKGSQSYAIGATFAKDIIKVQEQNRGLGVETDTSALLEGIVDTFQGESKLSPSEYVKSLAESESAIAKAKVSISQKEERKGKKYITEFMKNGNSINSPMGYYYHIDYPGDGDITDIHTVAVVVKEMLTDGTVVQDMEVNGKTLARPIADFPNLFQDAIRKLKNHGSLTMVVPPDLAYGEKGYPPKVPPNATVIYNLRIDDVYVSAGTGN